MARTRRGRLRQIERWLNAEFPPPRPTFVRVCYIAPGAFGDTNRIGNRIQIRIHSKRTWHVAIYALFEEWAHAMTWPLACVEDHTPHHGPEFGLAYSSILTGYFDNEGWKDSRDYSWE
jgi:hypothetical protein